MAAKTIHMTKERLLSNWEKQSWGQNEQNKARRNLILPLISVSEISSHMHSGSDTQACSIHKHTCHVCHQEKNETERTKYSIYSAVSLKHTEYAKLKRKEMLVKIKSRKVFI